MNLNVNGAECRTPCTVDKPAGSEVTIYAVPDFAFSPDTKAVFDGWTDGTASMDRKYTFDSGTSTLTARYRYLQKLTANADPEEGAQWLFDPMPEPGGWFPAGTQLNVTAQAQRGFRFKRFEGALSGPYNSGWLTMNTPATIVARLDRIPALEENSVRNAAGETPESGVAPGSLISIRGLNLAPSYERGPESPLTQTLQGVVVETGGRILPLVSVAPEEILAQLPSDLSEGGYTLTLRSPGQPVLMAKFTVVRNAPGLFRQPDAAPELPLALASHADGQPVTLDESGACRARRSRFWEPDSAPMIRSLWTVLPFRPSRPSQCRTDWSCWSAARLARTSGAARRLAWSAMPP